MSKAKKIAFCAVLMGLALALSYAERFIPLQLVIPLPGIKLGLANVVTLVALYRLKGRYAFAIVIPRCILGAIFGGGITGLLFSLTGGILALVTMLLSRKVKLFSVYGVSVLGAAAHNIGQILAAMALLRSVYVAAYLPWLLLAAIVTGLLTGAAGHGILRALSYATVSAPSEMSR
jgi:heptaprenyl diphosphate synthase